MITLAKACSCSRCCKLLNMELRMSVTCQPLALPPTAGNFCVERLFMRVLCHSWVCMKLYLKKNYYALHYHRDTSDVAKGSFLFLSISNCNKFHFLNLFHILPRRSPGGFLTSQKPKSFCALSITVKYKLSAAKECEVRISRFH